MEMNASNEVVRAYVNGPGMDQPIERIAFIGGTPRNRRVFHADGLGSIAALTDENGEPVQTYTYGAFGGIRARTGYDLNRITYTAREALGDSLGFYYYRNRVLDPNAGRFTSEDPLGFVDGQNIYIFVRNNPVIWIDSFGFASEGSPCEEAFNVLHLEDLWLTGALGLTLPVVIAGDIIAEIILLPARPFTDDIPHPTVIIIDGYCDALQIIWE